MKAYLLRDQEKLWRIKVASKTKKEKGVSLQYFIQLGLKKNGKIVKNQHYDLLEFMQGTKVRLLKPEDLNVGWFLKPLRGKMVKSFNNYLRDMKPELTDMFVRLIDQDDFSKKKGKKK